MIKNKYTAFTHQITIKLFWGSVVLQKPWMELNCVHVDRGLLCRPVPLSLEIKASFDKASDFRQSVDMS